MVYKRQVVLRKAQTERPLHVGLRRLPISLVATAVAFLACAQLNAQRLLRTHDAFEVGAVPEWYTGISDLNGDSRTDYLIAGYGIHPLGGLSGVAAFDGPTGNQIWFTPHRPSRYRTQALSAIGDINNDGIPDVAVTASNVGYPGVGIADVCTFLSGVSGTYLGEIVEFDTFGEEADFKSVLGLDDINGDGIPDVLLQRTFYEYRAYSGAPGHVQLYDVPGSLGQSSDQDVLGDVNSDGYRDFAVRYASLGQVPALRIHSGLNGQVLYTLNYSAWHTGVNDIDGDGVGDLATDWAGPVIGGEVYPYIAMRSGVNGALIWNTSGAVPIVAGCQLGLFMQSGGDVNGDGYDDISSVDQWLAVGVLARVVSGRTGAVLIDIDQEDIRSPGGCAPGGFRNTRILGDLDGDGFAEFAAADPFYNECGTVTNSPEWGRVYIFRGGPIGDTVRLCDPALNSTGAAARLNPIGAPEIGSSHLAWHLYNAPPRQFTQLAFGPALGPGAPPITIGSGLLCFAAQGAQRVGTPSQTDLVGTTRFLAAWPDPAVAANWAAGTTWVIQAIFRDHLDPARANTSNALLTDFY